MTEVHEEAEQWLLDEAARCSITKVLATAPGIGMIHAAQIVAIVISPNRFRTRQRFWSYCGLGIVTRSSSDWTRDRRGNLIRRETALTRGLNRNRHPMLKAIFKGVAQNVETMTKHPLHADFKRMTAAGMKPTLARITIARMIAAAMLAMWKNKEEYDPAKSQPKAHVSGYAPSEHLLGAMADRGPARRMVPASTRGTPNTAPPCHHRSARVMRKRRRAPLISPPLGEQKKSPPSAT